MSEHCAKCGEYTFFPLTNGVCRKCLSKDFKVIVRYYTFQHGYSNTEKIVSSKSLRGAKALATRLANRMLPATTFNRVWKAGDDGEFIRESDNVKSDAGHRDLIIVKRL